MRRILISLLFAPALFCQAPTQKTRQPDVNAAILEAAKMDVVGDNQAIAFWLPDDLLKSIGHAAAQGGTGGDTDKIWESLKDYQIFIVHRSYKDADGYERVSSKEDLDTTIVIRDAAGHEYAALKSSTLPEQTTTILEGFRRGMEQSSKGVTYMIMVFPSKDSQGHPFVSTTRPDRLTMFMKPQGHLHAESFVWHTPFSSLSVPRDCVKCGESLQASWSFCPYCGTALPAK